MPAKERAVTHALRGVTGEATRRGFGADEPTGIVRVFGRAG